MHKNENIKYFMYARRSIEKRDREEKVVSIDSQISEMKRIAKEQGLKVVGVFSETKSAKKPYVRVQFQDMIQQIQKGKANGILCWKMDRLARNPVDEGTIKYLLQNEIIKNIKATDRDWYPDDNALLASVEFGVATQYSRDLAKHVKRGLRAGAERGYRPHRAPVGYKNSKYREKGSEEILVDEERFPLVRKMFDAVLAGKYTHRDLLNYMNNEVGLTMPHVKTANSKMGKSSMYSILTNTFYYGEFEYPTGSGNWYKGNHKPMITKEEYDRVQVLLGRKDAPRPRTHRFAFTGLIKCAGCGASITAEEKWKYQKNGNVHHYTYYHCTRSVNPKCKQKAVPEHQLNEQILKFLEGITIPATFHEWAVDELRKMHQEEKKDRDIIIANQQREYDRIVSRMDVLLEMRMNQELTADEYAKKKADFEKQKIDLKSKIENTDQRIDDWLKSAENVLEFAEKAKMAFEKGNLKKRRGILSALGYNHSLKDKILSVQTEKPILTIQEAASEVRRIHGKLEPIKSVADQQHIRQKYAKSSTMWAM